jgi:hypothetical protein
MRATAVFHGILSDWVGVERDDFELPDGAVLADLVAEIGRRYRPRMPDPLWDDARRSFAKPVVAFRDDRPISSPGEPLGNAQEIKFLLMLAGG